MANKKFSRLEVISFFQKGEGKKMNTAVIDGKLYMCNDTVLSMCRNREIKSVDFVEEGKVTTKTGEELLTFKVSALEESNSGLITTAATIKASGLTKEDIALAESLL